MKLQELKTKVYELAGVDTTQQLKAKYQEIKTLDMRHKLSWEKALTVVQQQSDFDIWRENPPDEYKELFTEIETVSGKYARGLAEAKQLGQEVLSITSSLDALAEECQDEIELMKREFKLARQTAKQADLN